MKSFKLFLGTFVVVTMLSSCAVKVPFTQKVIVEYDLTDVRLKNVQFYTSEYIILEASNTSGNQYIVDGKIVDSRNNKNYRIVIQPQTKCVFEKMDENGDIYIRFEQGKFNYLRFALRKNDNYGRYYPVVDFSDSKNNKGRVVYENKDYYITSASSNAYLMVSIKKMNKTYGSSKYVKGMKVK